MALTEAELTRIQNIETAINELQTAINNAASQRQVKSILAVLTNQIESAIDAATPEGSTAQRLEDLEEAVNALQTAANNLASQRQLKSILAIISQRLTTLTNQIEELEQVDIGPALSAHMSNADAHTQINTRFYTRDQFLTERIEGAAGVNVPVRTDENGYIDQSFLVISGMSLPHSATHLPGAGDALDTAAAGNILPDDSAAEGSASSFARSDHKHGISAAAPGIGIGAGNTEGSSSSFARADHNHTLRTGSTDLTIGSISHGQYLVRSGTTVSGTDTGGGGATDHGALTGLLDDDHTQYLLADGSRPMSGGLDIDGDLDVTGALTTSGLINGVDLADLLARDDWAQNGFFTRTTSTLTWTDTSPDRTLSIQPTGASFEYVHEGTLYTSTGATKQIADTEGFHILYFDGDTLTETPNPTAFQLAEIIRTKTLVSIVYWDTSAGTAIYVGEERHGASMSPVTHSYLHYTRGLQYLSGLALTSLSVDGSGVTADAQFGLESGAVSDEDIYVQVSAITSTTGLPIFYMLGAGAEWQKEMNAGFSVRTYDGTSSTMLAWNEFTGGAWQLTQMASGRYVYCHVFATTDKDTPMIAVMGQNDYLNKPTAEAGAVSEISTLIFGGLPLPELRPIASVLFQTNLTYTNAVNARVVTTNTGENYVDWRSETISRVAVSTSDHGALAGLSDDDHPQYLLADGTRALSGDLDMGGNAIANVGNVDGVDVSAHASRHEVGGADELSVSGLSGLLTDPQTPLSHVSSHQNGGADELSVSGLSGLLADPQTPDTHASSHQNGGGDEISVAGLSGLLADEQTPLAHVSTHEVGGSDELSVSGLSGLLADPQTPDTHASSHAGAGGDAITSLGAYTLTGDIDVTGAIREIALKTNEEHALVFCEGVAGSHIVTIGTRGGYGHGIRVGANADHNDFKDAFGIFSAGDTGATRASAFIGVVGEANAAGSGELGIGGAFYAKTQYLYDGIAVMARALVDNSANDDCNATGIYAYSTDTHAVGANIGGRFEAANGTTNYAIQITGGDIDSTLAGAIDWDLVDNTASGLSFNSTDHRGLLVLDTTNDYEQIRIGNTASSSDFSKARMIVSRADTGAVWNTSNAGLVVEGNVIGTYSFGSTSGSLSGSGIIGRGIATNSSDSGQIIGVQGLAYDVHSGGDNIGIYLYAINGVNNYALYSLGGDFYSSAAMDWDLVDDNAAALSFDTTGHEGLLVLDTTDNAEMVRVGATAASADFPNARVIVSESDTGATSSAPTALVTEATASGSAPGYGFVSYGRTNGAQAGTGGFFSGLVSNSADAGTAGALYLQTTATHAGGANSGLGIYVTGGATNSAIDFYGGDITAYAAMDWDLVANNASALSFDTVGGVKNGILELDTTTGAEGVKMAGYLSVTGSINGIDVTAHASRHQYGGADELSVSGLSGLLADPQTPLSHGLDSHESCTLSGLNADISDATLIDTTDPRLSDARTPTSHASSHLPSGGDALTTAAPTTGIGAGNSEGSAESFARSDHGHKLRTTTGPTDLTIGAIAEGEYLLRSGTTLIGGTPAGGPGGGGVYPVGTPENNEVAVWVTSSGIEGDPKFTWDGSTLDINGAITVSGLVDGVDLQDHSARHENGGADEISVAGLSGLLADGQTPLTHASSHENGNADEISVAGLSGLLGDPQTPLSHASSHENGGADELTVSGLSGLLADPQTPEAHASSHQNGGSDEIATETPGAYAIPKAGSGGLLGGGWILYGTEASTACEGNDARLSDARTPTSHASSHESGGGDELTVSGLNGLLADPQTPLGHASSHQNGGSDEIATATPAADAIPKAGGTGLLAGGWITYGSGSSTACEGNDARLSDARTPTSHASSHLPSGGDPLATGAPVSIDPDDAQAEGTAESFARSDHQHAISTAAPSQGIGGSNAEGSGSDFARADHDHKLRTTSGPTDLDIGSIADGQFFKRSGNSIIGATVSAGGGDVSASGTPVDNQVAVWVTSSGIEGDPAFTWDGSVLDVNGNITVSGLVDGIDLQDHSARHDPGGDDALTTAAPGATGVATASAEGSAGSFARSDHAHQSNTAASTIQCDDSATIGTSGEPARADHKHAIVCAAPSQGVGGSNAEGSSTSFARADHDHVLRTTTGPTDLAIGAIADGEYVRRSGSTLIGGTPAAGSGGDVYTSGNPSDNQIAIWTASGIIEGDSDLTYDGSALQVGTSDSISWNTYAKLSSPADGILHITNNVANQGVRIDTTTDNVVLLRTEADGVIALYVNTIKLSNGSGPQLDSASLRTSATTAVIANTYTSTTAALDLYNQGTITNGVHGGTFSIYTGNNTNVGAFNTGDINIYTGNATGGNSGGVSIDTGTAGGTVGSIFLKTGGVTALTVDSSQNITLAGTVDGVEIDNHSARHDPGGGDALSTAAPSIGIGGANSEGSAASFARSDHNHKLRTTTGPTDLDIAGIADGEYLRRSGTQIIGGTPGGVGGGDVYTSGSPSDNQVAIWTASGVIEGDADLTYDGSTLQLGASDTLAWTSQSKIASSADHLLEMTNNAGQGIRLNFTTDSQVTLTDEAGAVLDVIANTFDGVDVSDHSARHDPGGGDALTTAAPGATGVATASAEGSAASFARSDHAHQSNTAASTIQCDDTATIGTSGEPARADHKHAIVCAAPGATGVGTASAEGSSTDFARSDHVHQSNTTPNVIQCDDTAAIGTSGEPARADHEHGIVCAAPSQGIGGGNSEGTSTDFARSDHDHTIRTTTGPTDLTVGAIADGEVLVRSGTTITSTAAGAGDVIVSGTPQDNYIAVWTDGTHIEGTTDLTYNGTSIGFNGSTLNNDALQFSGASPELKADTVGAHLTVWTTNTATDANTGDLYLQTGGQSSTNDFDSGQIQITTGSASTLGASGNITLRTGTAPTPGDIIFQTNGSNEIFKVDASLGDVVLFGDGVGGDATDLLWQDACGLESRSNNLLKMFNWTGQGIQLDFTTDAQCTLTDEAGGALNLVVNTVNSVDPASHGSRHDPDGSDAATTAAPGATSVGTSSAEGSAASFARSDHVHQSNTTPNTIEPDDAAVIGTSGEPARADHEHAIVCEAPAVGIGASNAEGSATSFSRSDHNHTIRESGGQDLTLGAIAAGDRLIRSGTTIAGEKTRREKHITIESPDGSDDITWFFVQEAVTITKVVSVVDSGSCAYTIRHGTDRSLTGAEVNTGGATESSTTTGTTDTSFDDGTVVANSWVWVETSGTPTANWLAITIFYNEDA